MARVPVQKQTMGTHSVLSEPELFTGPLSFPSNGNETQLLFTHGVKVLWGVQLRPGQADPDPQGQVKHSKKTTGAGYAGNYSPTTWCSILVDFRLQQHCCKNLKYRPNHLLCLKLYEIFGSIAQL